jgi:hypothetical protein
MQEWSGPGPFDSTGNVLVTLCGLQKEVTVLTAPSNRCFFLDARTLKVKSDATGNFPIKVTASFVDAGPTWRFLKGSVELGGGAGLMTATGDQVAVRPTLNARALVKPGLLAAQGLCALFKKLTCHSDQSAFYDISTKTNLWRTRGLHVLKFYGRGNVILWRLRGEDLGANGTSWDETNEIVFSRGFLIDLGELFPNISGTR